MEHTRCRLSTKAFKVKEEYIMKCTRCETQHQKNVTHCVVCNFLIDNTDEVEKPAHYRKYRLETIENIQNSSTHDEYEQFLKGNIKKYIDRYPEKNGVTDLHKARKYLDWLIEVEE